MPHSLVLNLTPQSTIYPNYLTGRHYHALFLSLVSSVDKNLGDILHNTTNDKAFTLSPLQKHRSQPGVKNILQWQHREPIEPGTPCWWRLSLLDDTLFSRLTQLWLNINPEKPWHLGSADLFITSILGTPQSNQSWASACTYAQLYDQASDVERLISFTFATPTAFRQGTYDTALPNQESLFKSLLQRWNKYSGIEISSHIIENIFPSFFNIRTEIVADSRSKFIGCVGDISYKIMGEIEPEFIKQINTIADFALYAGVGRKTPMGMGMVRRIK